MAVRGRALHRTRSGRLRLRAGVRREARRYTRRGFMARMRLSPFGEGQVFPHEETLPGPKVDRLMLMTICKANLSQVFGLYPDPAGEAEAARRGVRG